jgi:hypothetical protein
MCRVFQAITPVETMAAHYPHHLPAFRSKSAAMRRDSTEVDRQAGFVHRSPGRLRPIDAAPSPTPPAASAAVERSLLGAGPKRAVDARMNTASPHLSQRRSES